MSLVRNERLKLLATALNNLGIATIVTGLIAPIVATLYGSANIANSASWPLTGMTWLLFGVILHICGQVFLGELKP